MSDIPEEIWEEARSLRSDDWRSSVVQIARALLSAEARGMERERKRCLKETNGKWPSSFTHYDVARSIAAAIRNGTEASDA